MDESSNPSNRRSRRSPVLLAATLEVAGRPIPVKLRNLSEEGALIEGDKLPLEGTVAIFERQELRSRCRIVWLQGRSAGLAFEEPLKAEQVLRHVPAPRAKVQTEFRRPGLACRPLSDRERQMVERWMSNSPNAPGD